MVRDKDLNDLWERIMKMDVTLRNTMSRVYEIERFLKKQGELKFDK